MPACSNLAAVTDSWQGSDWADIVPCPAITLWAHYLVATLATPLPSLGLFCISLYFIKGNDRSLYAVAV